MRWTPQADAVLFATLLRILQEKNITIPYAEIATSFGHDVTVNAVQKRFQKMKHIDIENNSENDGGQKKRFKKMKETRIGYNGAKREKESGSAAAENSSPITPKKMTKTGVSQKSNSQKVLDESDGKPSNGEE